AVRAGPRHEQVAVFELVDPHPPGRPRRVEAGCRPEQLNPVRPLLGVNPHPVRLRTDAPLLGEPGVVEHVLRPADRLPPPPATHSPPGPRPSPPGAPAAPPGRRRRGPGRGPPPAPPAPRGRTGPATAPSSSAYPAFLSVVRSYQRPRRMGSAYGPM